MAKTHTSSEENQADKFSMRHWDTEESEEILKKIRRSKMKLRVKKSK